VAIQCQPIIDIGQLLQPLLLRSVFKGEELQLDAVIDVYVQDAITKSLLQNIDLPQEFADLGDVICLSLEMNKVKYLLAVLRGQQPPEGSGVDKVLEMVVSLQMLSALSQAFGGTEQTTTTS
jgi:hypothetical protein